MASQEKTPPQKTTDSSANTNAGASDTTTEAPTPSPTSSAADNGGEASAKPKVCSTDPLLFLFRLMSFFPSLINTYYEPPPDI